MISPLRFSVEIDPINAEGENGAGVHFRILAKDEVSIKKGGEIVLRYWLNGHSPTKDVPDTGSAMIVATDDGFELNETCVEIIYDIELAKLRRARRLPSEELSTENKNS